MFSKNIYQLQSEKNKEYVKNTPKNSFNFE